MTVHVLYSRKYLEIYYSFSDSGNITTSEYINSKNDILELEERHYAEMHSYAKPTSIQTRHSITYQSCNSTKSEFLEIHSYAKPFSEIPSK